jgi:cell division protein ZapA (FtsZ GTPase activity inhibitor)
VDTRITEIKMQAGLIESHKVAILAALSITDEMFQAQAQVEEIRDSSTRRAESLVMRLEEAMAGTSEE